jgi:hypothetical protein
MGRALGYLAALIAVIAGVGSALTWLADHAGSIAVVTCGSACLGLGVSALMARRDRLRRTKRTGLRHVTALSVLLAVNIPLTRFAEHSGTAALYGYVALAATPIVGWAYLIDRERHKTCPDCCEAVKVMARVCRFCGYDFVDRRSAVRASR